MTDPRARRGRVGVPIHAMSDIAFLLLIFIMLLALLHRGRAAPVAYPEAESGGEVSAERALEIWIDRQGVLYVGSEPVAFSRLEGIVSEEIAKTPSIQVQLVADQGTPFKHVERVLSLLQLLEHRVVSLIVSDPGPGSTTPVGAGPADGAPATRPSGGPPVDTGSGARQERNE